HPAIKNLKHVLLENQLLSKSVQKIFKSVQKKIQFGFIFGSAAQGSDTAVSDIDFFFVGELRFDEMSGMLFSLSQKLERECNGVVYSIKDFQERLKNPSSFIVEVMKGAKIWLWGDANEFTKMGQ
ncbi:MAG TPA: nucleotidyltransferase domain-containing protein, partial [Chlamydiales bacterium]|nr:nucleotidyltransferase domain-containing protein [Chlamydiales bacterium]